MRPKILLCLFALLAFSAANHARAQRRGGAGPGFARGGYGFSHGSNGFNRARAFSSRGYGHAYLPYGFGYADLPYDSGDEYGYAPQPAVFVQQPPMFFQPPEPPEPPVVRPPGHAVITNYTWPEASAPSSPAVPSKTSGSQPQDFAIVLKNGSTLSAVMIFASDDGLHYVDPDDRLLRISMSQVDRPATLKLNRDRNLNLHLPAAQ